jgi:hypothetical protein
MTAAAAPAPAGPIHASVLTPSAPPAPSQSELEDMLFDILATGSVDPEISTSTLGAVQNFLHEHARERRPIEAFVAFFAQHGLSLQPQRTNLLLTLPPIEVRGRATETPQLIVPSPLEPETVVVTALPADPRAPSSLVPAAISGKRQRLVWALGVAAIGGMLALLTNQLFELRAQLERAEADAGANAAALEELRSSNNRLRNDVLRNAQRVDVLDKQHEELLRSFGTPLDLQR